MNICMMTNTYLPHVGGVARSVHTFCEDYRKKRHKTLVVAPTFPDCERLPASIERHVVRLQAVQQFNGSDFSVRLPLTWMLNSRLATFKPDVVHSHHPYLIGDSALRYATDQQVPIVFTHHTLHEQYTHYVPFDSPALKQFVIELGTQYANLCDAVFAPSESIADLIRDRGVTKPIHVVPTGIDIDAFSSGKGERFRERHGLPTKAFVVGHLGRLAPEKNLVYLTRALCRFLKEAKNARAVIVGDGAATDNLRAAFEKEGLAGRIVMPGVLTGQDQYDAYAAMDAFAFASLSETQGMVLAEAMAAGLAVVALDASGVREVVRDGENGFLLPTKARAAEFADRLEQLRKNKRLRQQFSTGARQTARRFSRDRTSSEALALYKQLCQSKREELGQSDQDGLTALFKRMELEWSLVTQKTEALAAALSSSSKATP